MKGRWMLLLFCCLPLTALGNMHGPKALNPHSEVHQAAPDQSSTGAQAGRWLIGVFQHYISPADGPRSPSYPTGSAYGRLVIAQEGLFWGLLMTADRLFHESDLPLGPVVELHHKIRFYDPPLFNRYWRE